MGAPLRPRPADFERRFIELGWEKCPAHYNAHHRSIARWIAECGQDRLARMRTAYVSQQRRRIANPAAPLVPDIGARRLAPHIVRDAAHFLRHRQSGGWVTYPLASGDWVVGTHRRTEGEMVEMARHRGFQMEAHDA